MNAILLASAGVIVLLVGLGAGFWLGRSGVGGGRAKVEKAEAELEEYRRTVTEHFGQTAAHFQAIGRQYRELYEHMSSGAQELCEPDEAGQRLLFAPGADPALANVDDPVAEAVVEAEARAPLDFAASPSEPEPAEEPVAELTEEAEISETDGVEASADETTESQPETKSDEVERTLH
ncbi:MAG: DUF1043 family protein [Woeseiaceae bacterium]|nr:DUF1043 family protein [Woeseiaceae bacterium]